ncbi:MAG: sigma-70 family RNA polymerase sigma factor [Candidatus Pacebacteria bacterium]|nr:sigma-70 family RNA polymerase sigma factor [Candidatus Paceibacterota bacterium]
MAKATPREDLNDASDEEILLWSQTRPDVFEVLVERYQDAFLRKAKTIVYSKEDAEEIVQDTFTRIYLYASKYESQDGARFSSWAYTILTRVAFTRYQKLKKDKGRNVLLDPELYERLPDTEDFVEELSTKDEVLVALARMPERAARLLRFQFIEGKTQEEIAELEGSTVSAVKTHVHRAKKLFKKELDHGKS